MAVGCGIARRTRMQDKISIIKIDVSGATSLGFSHKIRALGVKIMVFLIIMFLKKVVVCHFTAYPYQNKKHRRYKICCRKSKIS